MKESSTCCRSCDILDGCPQTALHVHVVTHVCRSCVTSLSAFVQVRCVTSLCDIAVWHRCITSLCDIAVWHRSLTSLWNIGLRHSKFGGLLVSLSETRWLYHWWTVAPASLVVSSSSPSSASWRTKPVYLWKTSSSQVRRHVTPHARYVLPMNV